MQVEIGFGGNYDTNDIILAAFGSPEECYFRTIFNF